jgi:plastocyanin
LERLLSVVSAVVAIALAASWISGAYPHRQHIHDVRVINFAFEPLAVTITAGDAVRWTVVGGTHSATSGAGMWDSPDLRSGAVFQETFTEPGEYGYYCRIHSFMQGRVVVVPVSPLRAAAFWGVATLGTCALATVLVTRRRARRA